MKKVIKAAAAILCALGVGGGILSCSGGTNYVGTSGSSTTTTPPPTNSEPVADSWNFVTASPDILYDGGTSVANSAKAIVAAGTNTGASDGITYSLANDATIKGSDEKLTLTLQSAKVTAGSMSSSAIPVYAYADATGLRIKNNALKISNVVGNVILTVNLTAAGDSSRNLEVTVGTGGTTKTYPTSDKNAHEARFELACGTGSDVYIGASNNYWISAIGVAIDTATFASQTDSSTTNNEATLGLVGTTASSSDSAVATAAIADGKVAITSKGAGSATITVSNGTGNATIPVTVNTAGAITIGTIVKYSANRATAKTYSFASLSDEDISALGVTATEGSNKATAVVSETNVTFSNGAILKQSNSGKFKLEFTNKTDSTLEGAGATKTINYNTSSTGNAGIPDDISSLATVASLANIISIPVDGAGTVTVTGKFGNSTNSAVTDSDKLVAILYDADGNKLGSQEQTTKTGGDLSLSGTTTGATTVYIVFYRSSGYGGLKISSIEVAP